MSRRERYELAPSGFFRFTRWSHRSGETFASWREHFARLDVETRLVTTTLSDGRHQVALFVRGTEVRAEDTLRERRRLVRQRQDGISDTDE